VLAGEFALPILDSMNIGGKNRGRIKGWPERFEKVKGSKLFVGTVSKKEDKENLDRAPKQLRSMLEEWGYINQ
jgi:uncharacterized protein YktB (UPF0637 family)